MKYFSLISRNTYFYAEVLLDCERETSVFRAITEDTFFTADKIFKFYVILKITLWDACRESRGISSGNIHRLSVWIAVISRCWCYNTIRWITSSRDLLKIEVIHHKLLLDSEVDAYNVLLLDPTKWRLTPGIEVSQCVARGREIRKSTQSKRAKPTLLRVTNHKYQNKQSRI